MTRWNLFSYRTAWVAAIALNLTGCQHAPPPAGRSSFKVVEPLPDRTPPSRAQARESGPASFEQFREASVQEKSVVLPVYPVRARKAEAGAAQVGVRITVDGAGRVSAVRPSLLAITIAPPGFQEDFERAVEAAVRQWRFTPARVEHVETVTEQGFSYQRVTRTELQEAEFDLVFTFTPSGKIEAGR